MIHSMTGFGEAACEAHGHVYHVEIRSVNNRYFKSSLHLPDDWTYLEPEIEPLLRKRLTRGTVTLRARLRDLTPDAAYQINAPALQNYIQQLRAVAAGAAGMTIDLATLAALPGVCQPPESTPDQREQLSEIVQRLTNEALERLIVMRATEGRGVADDLRRNLARIHEAVELIRPRTTQMVDEYRTRLMARLQELLAGSTVQLAESDIIREVAIYAERCDISEELSRLASHLEQFEALLNNREPAGRKLDFIAQELLREANTIGSKCADTHSARAVIEMKSSIDRIKEQVQNVE